MIPAGLLDRLRLRARCYALRVRTVDELEQQRDDARGRARAAEVERDQARADRDEATEDVADFRSAADRFRRGWDDAQARASQWRREVAALTALDAETASDSELLTKLQRRVNVVSGSPGAILGAWQQVCRLVDPNGDLPLSPASIVDRVAVLIEQRDHARQAADAWRPPREAYDPAMGGDIEPPPGRDELRRGAAAGLAANLKAAAARTAQQRDVNAGHPDEVLDALQVADDPPAATRGAPAPLDRLCTALTTLARAVRAYPPGMTVDGDVLTDVITEACPEEWTDTASREVSERALDGAVRAGMTVLQGPDLQPRPPRVPREALSGYAPW